MSVPIVQIRDYHSGCDGGMTNRDRWADMHRARWQRGFTSCRSEGQHPGAGDESALRPIGHRRIARMQAADDCVFCRLIAGELEASVVYQDRRSVALMDIQPVTSGHVLVMPRTHGPSLADLDPDDGAQMFRVAQLAAAALRHSGLRCEGVNLFLADGAAAGQDVFHVHLHVFPRFEGDGFGLRLPPDYEVRPRDELDAAASALREAWPAK